MAKTVSMVLLLLGFTLLVVAIILYWYASKHFESKTLAYIVLGIAVICIAIGMVLWLFSLQKKNKAKRS